MYHHAKFLQASDQIESFHQGLSSQLTLYLSGRDAFIGLDYMMHKFCIIRKPAFAYAKIQKCRLAALLDRLVSDFVFFTFKYVFFLVSISEI